MMRFLIALIVLFFAGSAAADMRDRLCLVSAVARCPIIVYADTSGLASTDGLVIRISPLLERMLRGPDDFAFVIAHELGHIVARHGPLHPGRGMDLEYEADALATQIVIAAGYRCMAGAELLTRLGAHERATRVRELCRP